MLTALTTLVVVTSLFFGTLMGAPAAQAAGAALDPSHAVSLPPATLLLVLAGILLSGKVLHLVEKIKQPPVLGELLAGILLGNLALFGFPLFREANSNEIIHFMAQLGVIVLLFQIGLETNVKELISVGWKSLIVAVVGAVLPFSLTTFVVGPMLLPDASFTTHLFMGATLVATSVGISVRVFKDMGKLKTKVASIFLGATVVDDIISLILLGIVSALATGAEVTVQSTAFIITETLLFLIGSVVVGQLAAPYIGKWFAKIHTGQGSKFTLALSLALIFGGLASFLGLEPIIGAFAAGLVLDPVHFKDFKDPELVEELKEKIKALPARRQATVENALSLKSMLRRHSHSSIEELIAPIGLFLVPLFFVTTGISVELEHLAKPSLIGMAIILAALAYVTKIVAGLTVGGRDGWIIGLAMVPRGEVGLVFATVGAALGVFNQEVFALIVMTVLLTTVGAPSMLMMLLQNPEIKLPTFGTLHKRLPAKLQLKR